MLKTYVNEELTRVEALVNDNPDNWDANFDDEQNQLYTYLLEKETVQAKLDTSKEVSEKFLGELET